MIEAVKRLAKSNLAFGLLAETRTQVCNLTASIYILTPNYDHDHYQNPLPA